MVRDGDTIKGFSHLWYACPYDLFCARFCKCHPLWKGVTRTHISVLSQGQFLSLLSFFLHKVYAHLQEGESGVFAMIVHLRMAEQDSYFSSDGVIPVTNILRVVQPPHKIIRRSSDSTLLPLSSFVGVSLL